MYEEVKSRRLTIFIYLDLFKLTFESKNFMYVVRIRFEYTKNSLTCITLHAVYYMQYSYVQYHALFNR